jgi:hypothetical protein
MVTILKEGTTEISILLCVFFVGKRIQRIFLKKCFLFTVGSVCHVKRFTTGPRNSLEDVGKSQMMSDRMQKWLRQQLKGFYAVGFDALVNAMGQVYQCWRRICREIKGFFSRFEYHVLLFISICDLFTDPPIYESNFGIQGLKETFLQ